MLVSLRWEGRHRGARSQFATDGPITIAYIQGKLNLIEKASDKVKERESLQRLVKIFGSEVSCAARGETRTNLPSEQPTRTRERCEIQRDLQTVNDCDPDHRQPYTR